MNCKWTSRQRKTSLESSNNIRVCELSHPISVFPHSFIIQRIYEINYSFNSFVANVFLHCIYGRIKMIFILSSVWLGVRTGCFSLRRCGIGSNPLKITHTRMIFNGLFYSRWRVVVITEFANYEHKRKHKHKRKKSIQNQSSMTSFE